MVEITIDENAHGQRLDRYLSKLLPNAKKSLLQKSIRNKNITINKKKAKPDTFLNNGDVISIFFSDETFNKFKGKNQENLKIPLEYIDLIEKPLFENNDFIVVDKPSNLLTQSDKSKEISLTEIVKSKFSKNSTFSIAPLNRLDRNTSGIVIFPKNYDMQKLAAKSIRERNSKKLYHAIVKGIITKPGQLKDRFTKDTKDNKAILDEGVEISLNYNPLKQFEDSTLLEVELHTGKTHQIRSQLAKAGHPILGDPKYGDEKLNRFLKSKFNLDSQLLHAYNYILYDQDQEELLNVVSPDPEEFKIFEG